MVETITAKTKGKAKERPKNGQPTGTKEGREIVPLAYIQERQDEKKLTLAVGVAQTFKHKIPNGGEVSCSLMKFN